MKKDELKITRYFIERGKNKYMVFLMPDVNNQNVDIFYIQKYGFGLVVDCVGIELSQLNYSIEEFINSNVDEWIDIYEEELLKSEI